MSASGPRERAARPEDLSRLVLERLNAGDAEGLAALYEPDAVMALPDGGQAAGSREIRQAYEHLLTGRPTFAPGSSSPRCAAVTSRSPRWFCPVEAPPSKWPGASPTGRGCG